MGVRIPPRLPFEQDEGDEVIARVHSSRGQGGFGKGDLAEPADNRQLHGGRAGRHGRYRRLSLGGGPGTGPDRGSDSEMTNETSTKQWFVVHTYSGFENKAAAAIEQRAKIFGLPGHIN